jgi:exopolysaccharide biosynthesis polyprenyl glycosylphosphotransferase
MRKKDTSDVLTATTAVIVDALAIFGGFLLATWLRFDSGWFLILYGRPEPLYPLYAVGSAFAALVFLLVFRSLGLFARPQIGSFLNKIPRLVKGVGLGTVFATVLAFAVRRVADFSAVVIGLSFFTTSFFVLLERYILFRIEWNLARHSTATNRVMILGTDSVAVHVQRTLKRETMLRSKVVGFLRTDESAPDKDIPADLIRGTVKDLERFVANDEVDQIILTGSSLGYKGIVDLILLCEKNLITFNMVPDLFRIMTSNMDVQSLDDIPLLGISRWPLDFFWNRVIKRIEDIMGASLGLVFASPVMGLAAILVKLDSPGPVLFRQERCGEHGKVFNLYKLRTMKMNAEAGTGPIFAVENDPRRTRIGTWLRKWNLDELPQLWNVLEGHMSLVGPRPERPSFVEQFKEEIDRYMWRHVSKPGLTGWAQVNGLRGNTSIEERIKYDLYYLENWSLTFDFKILLKTFFARENAY